MIKITFGDTGACKYTIQCDFTNIGRQYDNIANAFQVIIPEAEADNTCSMIFTFENTPVDTVVLDSEVVGIYNNVTKYPYIDIAFKFTNVSGYEKNTDIKRFYMCPAMKPTNFVPGSPTIIKNVDTVVQKGYAGADYVNGKITFKNIFGKDLKEIDVLGSFRSGLVDRVEEMPEPEAGAPDFVEFEDSLYVLMGKETPPPPVVGKLYFGVTDNIPTGITPDMTSEDIPAKFAVQGAVHYYTSNRQYESFAYPASYGDLTKIYQNDFTIANLITEFTKITTIKDGVTYFLYYGNLKTLETNSKYQFLFN